jgi:hypothetical protein
MRANLKRSDCWNQVYRRKLSKRLMIVMCLQ